MHWLTDPRLLNLLFLLTKKSVNKLILDCGEYNSQVIKWSHENWLLSVVNNSQVNKRLLQISSSKPKTAANDSW